MLKQVRLLVAVLFLTLGLVAMVKPAAAYFEVCNRSSQDVSVAFGYPHDGDWVSEGWWNLAPGDCSTVYSFDLKEQKYYLYAEGETGNIEGDYVFCGIDGEFTIMTARPAAMSPMASSKSMSATTPTSAMT
jgi:uncharacterized membrane protein